MLRLVAAVRAVRAAVGAVRSTHRSGGSGCRQTVLLRRLIEVVHCCQMSARSSRAGRNTKRAGRTGWGRLLEE